MAEYKYATMRECESDGKHLARPPYWPPRSPDGSMSLRCVECGCNLIVYADRENPGTRIELPAVKESA